MNHRYDTNHIKTLDKIQKNYDVKHITHAFYPGLHCPLFASVVMSTQIEDLYVLVVGTEECAYYSKNLVSRARFSEDHLFSFVLDKNDITFGCGDKIAEAIRKIYREKECKALLIISTCVIELIGEDLEAIINDLKQELDCIMLLVRTNHYQQDSPVEGIEETLSALIGLMVKQEKIANTVNILGHKFDNFDHTELAKFLDENGKKVNVRIPTECNIDTIKKAPSAQLNIVTHYAALDLAKRIKNKFQINYVYFGKYTSPERIKKCYLALQAELDIDIQDKIDKLYLKTVGQMNELKGIVKGRSFVFGMPPMFALEISSFLCDLGMKPLWIQALGFRENEIEYKNEILKHANPKVFRALNIPFIGMISDQEKPYYCFTGINKPNKKTEYERIELVEHIMGIGFEVPINIMKRIKESESFKGK